MGGLCLFWMIPTFFLLKNISRFNAQCTQLCSYLTIPFISNPETSSQLIRISMVIKLLSDFVFILLSKILCVRRTEKFYYYSCSLFNMHTVLSVSLQVGALGFLIGTLAIFFHDEVAIDFMHDYGDNL